MNQHKQIISRFCNLCGCRSKLLKSYIAKPVTAYKEQVEILYGIDIDQDDTNIHPK